MRCSEEGGRALLVLVAVLFEENGFRARGQRLGVGITTCMGIEGSSAAPVAILAR
jgi:hypothetical protein